MFIPRTSFRGAPRAARLGALALSGAGALLLTALAPTALAEDPVAPPPAEAPEALFGDADPSYDGVWRQSYALLAQHTSGYTPATEAVDWLVGQQCADGSFLAFRADPGEPCADVTASESNATALAVQALAAVGGHDDAVDAGVAWLTGVQNEDGGWSFTPGGASDANSTAVVIGALAAAGVDPNEVVREGSSGYSALAELQLGCEAPEDQRGAFAWQPDEESGQLFASDMATVDAVLAAYGSGLIVAQDTVSAPVTALDCSDDADSDAEADADAGSTGAPLSPEATVGAAGAAQLAGALERGEGRLESTPPGGETQPDFGTTARAVLALSAGGHHEEARAPLDWLRTHHAEWADYATNPTALGLLVLVAQATDTSPTDFGGTNLLTLLAELGPDPAETPAGHADGDENASDDDGMGPLPWIIGIGLLAGILIGTLLSFRRRAAGAAADRTTPAEAGDGGAAGDEPAGAAGAGPAEAGTAGAGTGLTGAGAAGAAGTGKDEANDNARSANTEGAGPSTSGTTAGAAGAAGEGNDKANAEGDTPSASGNTTGAAGAAGEGNDKANAEGDTPSASGNTTGAASAGNGGREADDDTATASAAGTNKDDANDKSRSANAASAAPPADTGGEQPGDSQPDAGTATAGQNGANDDTRPVNAEGDNPAGSASGREASANARSADAEGGSAGGESPSAGEGGGSQPDAGGSGSGSEGRPDAGNER
ncbi:prenyltransferase/squalene oxidase repeat-containing protein [Streptomyces sp. NBRC 109706]|uniref:prenyltransferase/squalene oxidase repeat-containing protein n=1 Tax=Streptomyces sp. NBRC 109706 TaxID=1550035 RepID=UPI001F3D0345|nr:prenyltransferase/squalene oxidase repeat-containing protein [Streptomyces sp. NBRC 109706]